MHEIVVTLRTIASYRLYERKDQPEDIFYRQKHKRSALTAPSSELSRTEAKNYKKLERRTFWRQPSFTLFHSKISDRRIECHLVNETYSWRYVLDIFCAVSFSTFPYNNKKSQYQ